MPVLWHQFFLTIVKQYGSSMDEMSKASLAQLAKKKFHKLISPEILKELNWRFYFYLFDWICFYIFGQSSTQ